MTTSNEEQIVKLERIRDRAPPGMKTAYQMLIDGIKQRMASGIETAGTTRSLTDIKMPIITPKKGDKPNEYIALTLKPEFANNTDQKRKTDQELRDEWESVKLAKSALSRPEHRNYIEAALTKYREILGMVAETDIQGRATLNAIIRLFQDWLRTSHKPSPLPYSGEILKPVIYGTQPQLRQGEESYVYPADSKMILNKRRELQKKIDEQWQNYLVLCKNTTTGDDISSMERTIRNFQGIASELDGEGKEHIRQITDMLNRKIIEITTLFRFIFEKTEFDLPLTDSSGGIAEEVDADNRFIADQTSPTGHKIKTAKSKFGNYDIFENKIFEIDNDKIKHSNNSHYEEYEYMGFIPKSNKNAIAQIKKAMTDIYTWKILKNDKEFNDSSTHFSRLITTYTIKKHPKKSNPTIKPEDIVIIVHSDDRIFILEDLKSA